MVEGRRARGASGGRRVESYMVWWGRIRYVSFVAIGDVGIVVDVCGLKDGADIECVNGVVAESIFVDDIGCINGVGKGAGVCGSEEGRGGKFEVIKEEEAVVLVVFEEHVEEALVYRIAEEVADGRPRKFIVVGVVKINYAESVRNVVQ